MLFNSQHCEMSTEIAIKRYSRGSLECIPGTCHCESSCSSYDHEVNNNIGPDLSTDWCPYDMSRKFSSIDDSLDNTHENIFQHFRYLLKLYAKHADDKSLIVMSGGTQQYLNKMTLCPVTNGPIHGQPRSDNRTIYDLPDSVQLHIFSFLTAKDLCIVSQACSLWHILSCDNLLWQQLLERNVKHWNLISHVTNPDFYKECGSDWTAKQIYLRCCPEVNQLMKRENQNFHQLSGLLRSLWPRKTPKVAMFGPGLETGARRIVRKILEDEAEIFETTGMFPGQFEGIGSGFTMKMNGNVTFSLITLYTATREERENIPRERRRLNRLMVEGGDGAAAPLPGDELEPQIEVRRAVKDLCQTLDAFIFVVDAASEQGTVSAFHNELFALVDDRWTCPTAPVLILSCVASDDISRISCIDISRQLHLSQFQRPWQVHDCVVDTMQGAVNALEWLVEQAHRK